MSQFLRLNEEKSKTDFNLNKKKVIEHVIRTHDN